MDCSGVPGWYSRRLFLPSTLYSRRLRGRRYNPLGFARELLSEPYERSLMQPYLGHVVLYALVAVAMPAGIVLLALTLTKRLRTGARNPRVSSDTYESGMVPIGDAWIQYRAQYYLYSLI